MASSAPPVMNPWEIQALNYEFPPGAQNSMGNPRRRTVQDPIIYPGLYSPSGFDILQILMQVMSRPNPTVELGAIDCSVALILCDLEKPDNPIVYASEAFSELTGYSRAEVLGRNCRFLQTPFGKQANKPTAIQGADKVAIHRMRQAVYTNSEIQLQVTNYKKSGERFVNVLSIIPIRLNAGHRYAVGFQVEA